MGSIFCWTRGATVSGKVCQYLGRVSTPSEVNNKYKLTSQATHSYQCWLRSYAPLTATVPVLLLSDSITLEVYQMMNHFKYNKGLMVCGEVHYIVMRIQFNATTA